ncbi:MAG: restriction endonuclease, partial [Ktedonobacterales bacterium]
MAVVQKIALYEQLFAQPSMEAMLALSWQDFQDFVAHVFTCAGYTVECVANKFFPLGPGVDLNLYVGQVRGKPVARVEVRRYAPSNLLNFQDIAAFLGVLDLAQGIPGYMVTTSDFNGPAREAVRQANGRVRILNGARLLRYITYIGGSRLGGEYAGLQVAPTQPTAPDWLETAEEINRRTARPPRQTRVLVIANT